MFYIVTTALIIVGLLSGLALTLRVDNLADD